ncbi:Lipase/lipooxygenase [Tripterygium wilfordii]|uniref:Lipase/lipooxygenase n=1 Tax=Tripterygium wilfordii TaxID=458696 RepID=A0A7J7CA61_TRIWF|nr:PLAT domain-containing protein 3-like [Tripterygium wilfordii]KAF5731054.1 Lipase/lipooxygenase [Tripterygium wilfordii]
MESRHFSIVVISLFLTAASANAWNDCVYNIYVKTGSVIKGGTDSRIGLTLGDPLGRSVWVPDLESWGLMGPNHDYYERGNLDIFSVLGPCIGSPVCRLNVTSDGSGSHHGWYCDYVEITSTGPNKACSRNIFPVNRWLASDVPPFQLTAVIDECKMPDGSAKQGIGGGSFVVGNPERFAA